ncbi:uncharacterized protein A4U43_C05F34040 [Asparagus officinalis]|uniref:Uncharacterized protein n=1 Tax=Asparagus officinalis TaxID=4686 RepID=A0A5P1F105_ASPOF|nr:uncharacterized protein A4U43_C05F34040 [Asparagus officinalis]
MDGDGDLHPALTVTVAANEIIFLGFGEEDEVLAGGPVAGEAVHGAVVVADEIVGEEGLVVGPERVVDVGVPSEVAADDVVGAGGGGD